MSFQLEERRVSEDGYAYTKSEFQSHYNSLNQWNQGTVETRYDRDGATYTQRAFFEHYGGTDQWFAAIPANAYSDVNKTTTSLTTSNNNSNHHGSSFPELTPGWSSDRGPQAPDDGFFDTQGYGDKYTSYDDMAYSSNLYGHWSSNSNGGSSSSRRPSTSAAPSTTSASNGRRRRSTGGGNNGHTANNGGGRGPVPSMRSRSNSSSSLSSGLSGTSATSDSSASNSIFHQGTSPPSQRKMD